MGEITEIWSILIKNGHIINRKCFHNRCYENPYFHFAIRQCDINSHSQFRLFYTSFLPCKMWCSTWMSDFLIDLIGKNQYILRNWHEFQFNRRLAANKFKCSYFIGMRGKKAITFRMSDSNPSEFKYQLAHNSMVICYEIHFPLTVTSFTCIA